MKVETVADCICAAHLSSMVQSPFDGHGGLMLVGPPEALKTALLRTLSPYPNAVLVTDINTQQITRMRENIASGITRSIVVQDFQKIYERDGDTAANLEGNLRALASEGFTAASFENQQVNRMTARCVVMGALTIECQNRNFDRWEKSGFNRRFLWSLFILKNPDVLTEAIFNWSKLPLSRRFIPPPTSQTIPMKVTEKERRALGPFVRYQYGVAKTEPLQMLIKMYAVLKWHYTDLGKPKRAWEVITDFAESLTKEGAKLEL